MLLAWRHRGQAAEASARAAHAAEAVSHEGTLVQYLFGLFPGDEVVLFEFGGALEAVRRASERAELSVERIVEALRIHSEPALLPHGKEAPPMITSYEAVCRH